MGSILVTLDEYQQMESLTKYINIEMRCKIMVL